jgi:hypothetical protein
MLCRFNQKIPTGGNRAGRKLTAFGLAQMAWKYYNLGKDIF